MHSYPSHKLQIPRINRAIGQLEGIKRMITDKKYCIDIINQLRAARNAIRAAELVILKSHLDSCVHGIFTGNTSGESSDNNAEKNKLITEIIDVIKKYE